MSCQRSRGSSGVVDVCPAVAERVALLFRRFRKLVLILKGPIGFVPKNSLTVPLLATPAVLGFVQLESDPEREHEDEDTRKLAKGSTPDILLNPERPKDLTSRREQNSPDIAHNAPKPGSADPGDGFHEPESRSAR